MNPIVSKIEVSCLLLLDSKNNYSFCFLWLKDMFKYIIAFCHKKWTGPEMAEIKKKKDYILPGKNLPLSLLN